MGHQSRLLLKLIQLEQARTEASRVIVKPDPEDRLLVVITAYPVQEL